jgi:divalent metal cation (Fe/Co/Zn/Cd) transporter
VTVVGPDARPLLQITVTDAAAFRDACCRSTDRPTGTASAAEQRGMTRRVIALSWISLIWMSLGGILGLSAGLAAASIALIGWALGSIIEGAASIIVIWRFTGTRAHSDTAEHRAQRAVAVSFFLLAPYIVAEAIHDLSTGHHATTSMLGIIVTAISLLGMPTLGAAKRRYGYQLQSAATRGEGTQNLICAAQAGAVLIGLVFNATTHVAWTDPAIALLLAAWATREGIHAWHGEDCC